MRVLPTWNIQRTRRGLDCRAPPSLPPWPLFNIGNSVSKFAYGLPNALVPPAIRILDIGFAFTQTHVLYALSKLEIPAALESGPKTAEELAPLVGNASLPFLFPSLRCGRLLWDESTTQHKTTQHSFDARNNGWL